MPVGQPTPDQIITREVSFFSMDTNVLEGKHFDFKRGALNVLHAQRPDWMTLQLTEVVSREVTSHRMRELTDHHSKLNTAVSYLRRKADFDVSELETKIQSMLILDAAKVHFETQLQAFVAGMGGRILDIAGDTLAKEIFTRYFLQQPPFEFIKDKKSEFPDAAALLVLEQHAKNEGSMGVLISKDKGWHSFAKTSNHLFCVNTLEEFTAFFDAMGAHAEQLLEKVRTFLRDVASETYVQIEQAIKEHVADAGWTVDDLYSGYAVRLEGEVYDAGVIDISPDFANIQGWFKEEDTSQYVVEIPVSVRVEVDVSVEFFQWDSVDREEIAAGSQVCAVETEIEFSVFLTCSGELVAQPVSEWDIDIEIAAGDYSVDVGEVNPDFSGDDHRYESGG